MLKTITDTASFLKNSFKNFPDTAVILGSGLGYLGELATESVKIPYSEIPGFKVSAVPGHAGQMIQGKLQQKNVLLMQGRYHFYEGHSMWDVTFPVRALAAAGIRKLIITNAAGGINPFFEVGDLMLLTDHINLGPNPLIGVPLDCGARFIALDGLYSPELKKTARQKASELSMELKEGVYLYTTGPTYETKAEIRFFHHIGADAVGMSTVPEAIAARHAGISQIMAFSMITNKTLGNFIPTHEEVVESGRKNREKFASLICSLI